MRDDLDRIKADTDKLLTASPAEQRRRLDRALATTPLGRAVLEERKQAVGQGNP